MSRKSIFSLEKKCGSNVLFKITNYESAHEACKPMGKIMREEIMLKNTGNLWKQKAALE